MSLKQYEKNNACVVELPEQLMMADCSVVKTQFLNIIDDSNLPVLIDFSNLDFMDSSGLGVLVNAYQKAKKEGIVFMLYNIKPSVLSLIKLTQLDQIFEIYSDEDSVYKAVIELQNKMAAV